MHLKPTIKREKFRWIIRIKNKKLGFFSDWRTALEWLEANYQTVTNKF